MSKRAYLVRLYYTHPQTTNNHALQPALVYSTARRLSSERSFSDLTEDERQALSDYHYAQLLQVASKHGAPRFLMVPSSSSLNYYLPAGRALY